MQRGCFLWTLTPPLLGRRTPRPGHVRVCLCVLFLAGSGGPASRARFGVPDLFLWAVSVLSLFARLPPSGVVCFLFFFCAPRVSGILCFPARAALGLDVLSLLAPQPPQASFFFPRGPRYSFISGP